MGNLTITNKCKILGHSPILPPQHKILILYTNCINCNQYVTHDWSNNGWHLPSAWVNSFITEE